MKPLILALITLCTPLQAEVWTGTSDVRFKGTSTLHDFEGTVTGVPLEVMVKGEKGSRMIRASSTVEVRRMSTDEKDRDKNMWVMFKAAAFQFITITVPETSEKTLRPADGKPGIMPVTLTIAGTSGTVTGSVKNLRESATAASFDLTFDVSLKAFNLKPPSTLAGLVKVGDTVVVNVRVSLARPMP